MNETADWSRLTDAKGESYDPRPALDAVANDDAARGYDELWERLHHQGDLGTAAYAAVPELVRLVRGASLPDWRPYALIATIEERRRAEGNPPLPQWLSEPYSAALVEVVEPATAHLRLTDADLEVRSLLATIAQAKGQRTIGAMSLWTEDERAEALGEV
jgi:hypothetical protein